MALTITDNSVRQINAALLSLEKKIGETNSEKAQDKQAVQMELKNIQYDFMAPLYQSGNSVGINTTGTWEGNANTATTAKHAATADNAEHANTATSANLSKTLDNVNGDKLQIGSGTAQNVTNAKHAATADAFSTTYISYITPAQAAAMKEGSTIWPLSYDKNYLQTVTVTWDDYSSHTFPAGAAGMFFPGYSSNGGTLILINYISSRMLYNVWIESNRWSGWHYIDMPDISYT